MLTVEFLSDLSSSASPLPDHSVDDAACANVPCAAAPSSLASYGTEPLEDRPRFLANHRVLVVDDDYDAREVFTLVLRSWGATAVAVESARQALQAYKELKPHVIVSDIAMPRASGYWFIREIRKLPSEAAAPTPAIAITAYTERHDEVRARRAGFDAYLTKPVELRKLRAALERLTRRI